MIRFDEHRLDEIIKRIQNELKVRDIVEFEVLNPDTAPSAYAGQIIEIDNKKYIYRDYRAWSELANILHAKIMTPLIVDENIIKIRYQKIDTQKSFHLDSCDSEKYGTDSTFANITKSEEPVFLYYYTKALELIDINSKKRVLNIGINSGEEFEIIKRISSKYKNIEFVGIDYCKSAIDSAKESLNEDNFHFIEADINNLSSLNLGKFDLIITIGTLQSSNIEFKPTFMSIVQNHLEPMGAMILGFPNCRWIDGTIVYGAMIKNYPFSELSNLYKDVYFCKKYLQQKKFRVMVIGKEYIFLVAKSIK
jgi:2-polyprenyl-3-methyl-5-hydroxy-6-metoxy-1,4-benzoquinol methylase